MESQKNFEISNRRDMTEKKIFFKDGVKKFQDGVQKKIFFFDFQFIFELRI